MLTVEFKLDLNQSQQTKVDDWLNVQRWVWNRGLHLLEEFESFTSWDKVSKAWTASCPIPWSYYKDDDNGQLVPFTRLAQTKPYRMSCPIPQAYRQPELESPNHFGLLYYFAQKNHEDKPWFCEVPSKVVAGTLKSLADAWSEYKAGKRKRPRFKRYKDKLKTLINNNSKSVKISGKQITLPKLGKVTVKTLDKRWDATVPIATLKIVKEPSGYYLQLTGELPKKRFKPSKKAVGLALGYRDLFTTDGGKVVEPPAYYQKMERRLQRLQRKLSRQQNLSPITTYNAELGEHFLSCPINPHKGANQAKTQQKISRQHEKIRRARKAFNHKISTKVVREYGAIATTKSSVRRITRRPKPIVNKEGTGYDQNGAVIKSQFNKMVLASGLSQFTTLVEQKAAVNGREYIEIAPKDLPDEPRQRAEHYSKRLQLPRALHLSAFPPGIYRPWGWEVAPAESLVTLKQEVSKETPLGDAKTTSNSSSEPTNPHGLVGVPQPTFTVDTSNHQQSGLSAVGGGELTRATAQNRLVTESEPATSSNSEPAKQHQTSQRRRTAPSTSENKSGKRKRRRAVENDSALVVEVARRMQRPSRP